MRNTWLVVGLLFSGLLGSRALAASDFTFVVIADSHIGKENQPQHQTNLRQAVDRINLMNPLPQAVLFAGDLTDHGLDSEFDAFVSEINRLNPSIIKAPVPGNHEAESMTLAAGYQVKVKNELNYSFDVMGVHFVGITTIPEGFTDPDDRFFNGRMTTSQLTWVENDLKTTAAKNADWAIVYGHHPLWNSNAEYGLYGIQNFDYSDTAPNHNGAVNNAETTMIRMMDEYNVGLYLGAHRHFDGAAPILHTFPDDGNPNNGGIGDGSFTNHVSIENMNVNSVPGYEVFTVNDGTISSYHQNLNGTTEHPFSYTTPRTVIPEPSTAGLLLFSGVLAATARRRRVTTRVRL